MVSANASRLPDGSGDFDSSAWFGYFAHNRESRQDLSWDRGINVEPHLQKPLIRSLQRFQVGESGDGTHLIAGADATGDQVYAQSIRLFIAEEQEHARMLASAIQMMGGTLLDGHWSDRAFILLRRLMGLRMELMVLLIAEMIARRYYRALYDGTADHVLRSIYEQIMADEVGHVRFHCDYLRHAFGGSTGMTRSLIHLWWGFAFRATCLIVIFDHRGVLRACGVSKEAFWHDCGLIFSDAATRIFGNREAARQFLAERA